MRVPLDELRAACGPGAVLDAAAAAERAVGWSRLGAPLALLRPTCTDEVAAAVKLCAAAGVAIVPWGGKTGLVDGACADDAVACSLERMNRIESVDAVNRTMTVQAGCIVQTACEAADAAGLFFPLDLGSRGTATVGGTISTNAGGNRVVRFGMMRELVLGLEAVLADGTVVTSMHPHIKNNTGYDLKQLFIGSEGTLGIVTRAVLRLRPRLSTQCVALAAVSSFSRVLQTLHRLEAHLGGRLSAFEVMWNEFYQLVTSPPAKSRPILAQGAPYYILIEALGGDVQHDAASFEAALSSLLDDDVLSDAAVAQSQAECAAIWALRDEASEVKQLSPLLSFDVSLGHSAIEAFDTRLREGLSALCPGARLAMFGHVGDGNIHVIAGPLPADGRANAAVTTLVYDTLCAAGGSISAEHGIGLDKRDYLPLSRSATELALMRSIKRMLDPANILNPGKILPVDPQRP